MNFIETIKIENFEFITQVLFDFLEDNYRTNKVSYSYPIDVNFVKEKHPEIIDIIESAVNDTLHIMRVFVTMPNNLKDKDVIHSDGSEKHPKYLALNWPMINTAKSTMCWYSASKIKNQDLDTYGSVQLYDPTDAVLLAEHELLKPSLVRIDIPHNIKNYNDTHRVIISFRFKNELRHINLDKGKNA